MLRTFLICLAAVAAVSVVLPAATSMPAAGSAAISAFLKDAVDKGQVPGIVALVVGRDGVIYHEAFGKQDVGKNVPMAKDSIFRIASMTKPVTSMGVMMLVEEGKIGLDDDAAKWVPTMRGREVMTDVDQAAGTWKTRPAKGPITIRQLLTHTSGIGYNWSDPGLALVQRKEMPQEDALPLVADPGTLWTYGSSTRVLGDVIEKASGQRIDAYLQARLLGPLGMRDTFFEVPKDRYGRVVTTHQKRDGKFTETPNPATLPVQLRADGGLLSTADDYAKFIRMMLNGGQLGGGACVEGEYGARDRPQPDGRDSRAPAAVGQPGPVEAVPARGRLATRGGSASNWRAAPPTRSTAARAACRGPGSSTPSSGSIPSARSAASC